MKIVIFAVVALVLGLAGGTGIAVMRAPRSGAVADTTGAHGAGAPADSAAVPASPGHAAPTPESPHVEPAPAPDAQVASRAHGTVASPLPPAHEAPLAAVPAPGAGGYAELGGIFARMKPADVARIAAYLEDAHLEGVLRTLGARQAAVLLAGLPPERAARLSRRIIESPTPPESR